MSCSMFSFLCIFSLVISTAYGSILKTSINAGTIQGAKCPHNDATAFQAIPFAQPPVGKLRFAAPQPFQDRFNNSVLDATTPAPACIQFGSTFLEQGPTSEDCLYLDVWVPPTASQGSSLPVKVWLYGGADTAGGISNPTYNGCNLAMENTLLVSINYRLGPLGFLALDTAGIHGNQAIQDILLGLQWVQDNIASFGGSPKQVLLFGQSAGADNTFIVSTLPQAPRLITAAIPQSGGGRTTPAASAIQALGFQYAKALKCSIHDATCLQSIPTALLNSTLPPSTGLGIDNSPVTAFGPYIDGIIIPTQPATSGTKVPTIFGTNTMEGALFILAAYGQRFATLTQADYLSFLHVQFDPSLVPRIAHRFPLSALAKSPYPVFSALANIITDTAYKCPAYRGLKTAIAHGIPAFTYLDAHNPTCESIPGVPAKIRELLGATHAVELPLVFGRVTGLQNGTCSLTDSEARLSEGVVKAWSAMAAKGDPSSGGLEWPRFRLEGGLGVNINETLEVGEVDYSVCEFWDRIQAMGVGLGNLSATGNGGGGGANETGSASASATASVVVGGSPGSTSSLAVFTGLAPGKIVAANTVALAAVAVVVVAVIGGPVLL